MVHRVALLVVIALCFGCFKVPEGKQAISSVEVEGAPSVDHDDLLGRIATRETSKGLGLFYGFLYDYTLFDRYALRRDLQRIERTMRARGFYDAKVHVARVVQEGNKVRVVVEVEEGPPVLVDTTAFTGAEQLDEESHRRLDRAVADVLPKGARLDEDKLDDLQGRLVKALTARGYAAAKVERHVEVDLASAKANLRFDIETGPLAQVGEVRIEGLGPLPEAVVRRIFRVREGDRWNSEEIDSGRQALLELGVFAAADVEADLSHVEADRIVPITLKCEVAKLHTLSFGGGFEFDSLKTDLHTLIGWQNTNFLGGLRRFDLKWKPGAVLFPTRFPDIEAPEKILFEQKLSASIRQPGFLESRTTGTARTEYSVFPVLLPGDQKNVLGYHELRGAVGLERTLFKRLYTAPQYAFQTNFPFDYVGRTPGTETLVISYIDILAALDFRDDPNHTKKGFYIGNQLQFAGGLFGGDAWDIRVQPEFRGYVQISKRLVFAARGSVGFLFPFNYGRRAEINFDSPGASRIEGGARDYQLLFFRGFFAGGPSSNRGYALRGIGPYDTIPYLSPAGQSLSAGGCNPSDSSCTLPTGGLSLWEANAELRIVVSGPFSTAIFCDAADVSPFRFDIRPQRPHLSCGGGARYDTPVGPIRLDIGYRIPGLQYFDDGSFERAPDDFFGVPLAFAFGIGEAF
ncbi:MAG: BamA/TamA family outer membrane protein [Deltaproteobacteria bacterium]|nr:BamA/TamA family outer membrane protein [Deltaproteobacteria bacterium]